MCGWHLLLFSCSIFANHLSIAMLVQEEYSKCFLVLCAYDVYRAAFVPRHPSVLPSPQEGNFYPMSVTAKSQTQDGGHYPTAGQYGHEENQPMMRVERSYSYVIATQSNPESSLLGLHPTRRSLWVVWDKWYRLKGFHDGCVICICWLGITVLFPRE